MSREPTDTIHAIPTLWAYAFVAVSVDATLTGYFVDAGGLQLAAAVSGLISTPDAVTFKDINGGDEPPEGAEGFVGALTGGSIYVGLGGKGDYSAPSFTPESGYPIVAVADFLAFGKVA